VPQGPQAVFFLGDGGWAEEALLAAAQEAKRLGVVVHSIAFFTSGGGLPQIADLTGGTYREINGPDDLAIDQAPQRRSDPAYVERRERASDSGSGSGSSDEDRSVTSSEEEEDSEDEAS
jgi:hypothetical protein